MSADRQQRVFDDIVAGCGGIQNMTPLHVELATLCSALIASAQDDPTNLPKTAGVIESLLARLPAAPADAADDFSLARLSDVELATLYALQLKATDSTAEPWSAPEPPAERPMGECEARACELGRFLDQRERGPLSERERIEVMNHFTSIGYPAGLILREVYRPLWQVEVDSAVRETEDRILKAEDRKLLRSTR